MTSDLKLINSAVFLYFFITSLKLDWFYSFFFFSKCCCYFFNTLVKHGHIAPDYRLQNHIHTCLSHRDAPTQMQRGSGGGMRLYLNHPLLVLGSCPKADPLPLIIPKLVQFSIFVSFFFFFLFFLAKVNLSNHRNQTCVSLQRISVGMQTQTSLHVSSMTFCLTGPCCSVETHSLSLPLTRSPKK